MVRHKLAARSAKMLKVIPIYSNVKLTVQSNDKLLLWDMDIKTATFGNFTIVSPLG